MATIVAAAGGGNWTDGSSWDGGIAPTAADDAQLASTSGNLTWNSGSACRSITDTGYTGVLTHTAGVTVSIGDGSPGASNVALLFGSGMTYTKGDPATSVIAFVSTSSTQQTISTPKSMGGITINGAGSSYILSQALTGTGQWTLTAGAFDANDFGLTFLKYFGSGTGTRSLLMGVGNTWATSGTDSTPWEFTTTTNLTFNAEGSTIYIDNSGGTNKVFNGGGLTYKNATFNRNSRTSGSNTFDVFTVNPGLTINFAQNTTTTFLSDPVFVGTAGSLVTIVSNSAGTAATWSKSSGIVTLSNCSIKDISAGGGALWRALSSVNVSGNSGIQFVSGSARRLLMGVG